MRVDRTLVQTLASQVSSTLIIVRPGLPIWDTVFRFTTFLRVKYILDKNVITYELAIFIVLNLSILLSDVSDPRFNEVTEHKIH